MTSATADPVDPARERFAAWIAAGLLVFHAALLAWMAIANSPTVGEIAHLPCGLSHWQLGRFDLYRVNPPLVRLVAAAPLALRGARMDWLPHYDASPGSRAEFSVAAAFLEDVGEDAPQCFTVARWACLPFSLVGGFFCFRWASILYGRRSGLVALLLWCVCPNILANSALITPDAGAASLGVGAAYFFDRWSAEPRWPSAAAAGISLGLAELTKASWVVLYGLWPVLWTVRHWFVRPTRSRPSYPRQFVQMLGIIVLAVYVVNVGYGFERSCMLLRNFKFVSRSLAGAGHQSRYGNRFAESWFGYAPVPVPANYLEGIDTQKFDFEQRKWSYLRGEQRFGGWWYFYLYALAVKVPLGVWCLTAITFWVQFRARDAHFSSALNDLVVVAPPLLLLTLVSLETGFTRYLRYVLPALPFLFVWISKIAVAWGNRRRLLTLASLGSIIWAAGSSLAVLPHSLSYFNELAGGPIGGHKHLLDANIDWGQDLGQLKDWAESHPEARPLYLSYFGLVDPRILRLDAELLADVSVARSLATRSETLRPGWYAISVNHLHGYRHFGDADPDLGRFLRLRPVGRAGYSIYIYHVPAAD